MEPRQRRIRLSPEELPPGFVYPSSFEQYLERYPECLDEIEPWGIVADPAADARYSHKLGQALVKFAQAWFEDMIACFVVGSSDEPKVVVLNPWAQTLVGEEWKESLQVVEELPNFDSWLEWVRNSDLVKTYAEVRAERAGPRNRH